MNNKFQSVIKYCIPYLPKKIRLFCYYRLLISPIFPEVIHIENTNACNARCTICAREKMHRPIGFMDINLFKKIIDECSKYRIVKEVHLHGYGEPLLDKMLIDKIRYAKAKGIKKTYFVTNASFFNTEAVESIISAGLDRIKFSFYGATKDTYEKIHLGLNFEKVEENIRNFFYIREKMKSSRPSVNIQFVPQSVNLKEKTIFLNKWEKLINKKKGDRIEEFYLHNWIYGRGYNPIRRQTHNLKSCAIPFRIVQILWNGDVVPCVFDFNGKMPMGEIKGKDIKEVWNNGKYQALRKTHRNRNYQKAPLCMACDQLREV